MAISANFGQWLGWLSNKPFFADYLLTWTGACVLYGGLIFVPTITWLLSCRGHLGSINLDYAFIVCVFGYSLWPVVPISLLCALPSSLVRTILCSLGFVTSVMACYKYMWLAASDSLPKIVRTTLLIPSTLCQAIIWGVFRWYFLKK
jgi:hypothetical protein